MNQERSDFVNATSRQKALEPLYRIKRKQGFEVKIQLTMYELRINLWPEIFDLLRSIVEAFEKERASVYVEVFFNDFVPRDEPFVTLDVTSLARSYDPLTWREDVVKFYDKV